MSRGRVVMLVDNAVHTDSRVQKQARSAAELGWDVVLIGRSPTRKVQRFRLGEARVRLVPVPNTLMRPWDHRRHGVSRLLTASYPDQRVARFRRRQVESRRHDARMERLRREQQAQDGELSRAALMIGRARAKAALARSAAEDRWVSVRSRSASMQPARTDDVQPPSVLWTRSIERTLGDRAWRVLDPHLWDFELAFGPVIDKLRPDIIHANDFNMIGVGARAAVRARAAGRPAKLVYDAHEFVPGMNASLKHPWWLPARIAYEREHIGYADAVVTVSEPLADMLVEAHGLPRRPAVVLNAPPVEELGAGESPADIRELCGIDQRTPLLIYSGSMTAARGVQIMVEALPQQQGVHVAFIVATTDKPFIQDLIARAEDIGVGDRVHFLPYVPPEQVVSYVAPADVGVHPTHHLLNHEISLASKFFEYSHARLPIVVSDVRTMAEMVRSTGQGEVFRAEDLPDYVRAVQAVLDDPQKYRSAYDRPGQLDSWTWRRQAEVLDTVYDDLMKER